MITGVSFVGLPISGQSSRHRNYHRAWDGDVSIRDKLRTQRLIELGWDVLRFWVYEIRDDLDGCVDRVREWSDEGLSHDDWR